jgi:hypothetical protein
MVQVAEHLPNKHKALSSKPIKEGREGGREAERGRRVGKIGGVSLVKTHYVQACNYHETTLYN